nr:MAG: F0F1 ATP synthase subunit delta [Pseudomonadota bacterium]
MAARSTIARPYARAAFEEAREKGRLDAWSQALRTAAAVVRDPNVEKLIGNPHVAPAELAKLIVDVLGEQCDEYVRNFVYALAENQRLGYLPEISEIFDDLKDEAEGWVDVEVRSAAPLTADQQETLAAALSRRLNRKVRLHTEIDPALIGGAVLRAGDLVIDGSLRARLERIAQELSA